MTCVEDRRDAFLQHRAERLTAIRVHAAEVLGVELDRRQRILDLVRDLPRHLGPRLETMGSFELGPLPLQVARHAVEVLDQTAQLVGRGRGDPGIEVAARDAPRGARQTVHRIGDALGHRVAEAGAAENEEQRGEQHAPIQRVDLLIDLPLP